MHGLVFYVKEGLLFVRYWSLQNSADSYLCFRLAKLYSVSYVFFLYQSPSSYLCTVFDYISSNVDEVLSINPSAVFAFGVFNDTHSEKTLFYLIQYQDGWLAASDLFICLHNQVLYIPLSRIKCTDVWKNVIHQIDSQTEWLLLPASLTAKFGLVFVSTLENAFS